MIPSFSGFSLLGHTLNIRGRGQACQAEQALKSTLTQLNSRLLAIAGSHPRFVRAATKINRIPNCRL